MLRELHIHRLGVIESADLRLDEGLTVVTGETGAGKTLVLSALGLLTGARADTGLVRAGEDDAVVEGVVVPSDPGEWGTAPGEELVVSREVPADGRSRARINGRLAPASALTELLGEDVEIHAQHEHVRLARHEVQRRLLDRWAGEPHARNLAAHADAWRELARLRDARARAEQDGRDRARELAMLRHELEEIDRAELDPALDEHLDDAIDVLAHAEDYREAGALAASAFGDDGAAEAIATGLAALRRLPGADDGPWAEQRDRAAGLLEDLRDVAATLRDLVGDVDADPRRLAELQARKRVVTDLCRRFGPAVADVLAFAEQSRTRLAELELADAEAGDLDDRLTAAQAAAEATAEAVRRGRVQAGSTLEDAVRGHLADLAMPQASFEVDVQDAELGPHGADGIRFLLAPNPGEPAAELAKAASGGERSRVSLAIEVALADVQDAKVLVFDEVDAGIGGSTALAVGQKLARLARGRQVLCVTHLAQLAAFADAHHVVEKGLAGGRTITTVRAVDGDDARAAEIARMLSGADSGAGLEHARELLDLAARARSA